MVPRVSGRGAMCCRLVCCERLPVSPAKIVLPLAAIALLAGCQRTGEIDASGGVGITALRSPCPYVAVPAGTGDITLFTSASREADAIDVVATMTNVTSTCDYAGEQVVTNVNFEVQARRSSADGARDVSFPYYIAVVRGGSSVVAKHVGRVTVHFDAGQLRASARATGSTQITKAAATLPADVRERLTRKRKAGDESAATDPLADPAIRSSVASASFEALVGFQLTDEQLKYNVTR